MAEIAAWAMPTNKASLDAFNAVIERASKRTKQTNVASITSLPECMLSHACSFLPADSLLKAGGVCKLLQAVTDDDTLWRDLCIACWPSTLGLAVRSYLKFYQQRKGKLAAQNEPQKAKLSDYTLLFDVSSTADGRKVQICSKAVSLTGMAEGVINVAFSVPWRAVKPMTKFGRNLSSDAPIIEGLLFRNSDSKTLLVSSQVVDDSEDDGSSFHFYYPSEPLAAQAQWFDNVAPDIWFEGGWTVVIEAPKGAIETKRTQPAAMANMAIELQLRTFAEYGDIDDTSNEQVLQFLGHAAKWS
jgi:hypothetical protein